MKKRVFKTTWLILRDTFSAFGEDRVMKLSAALSYYTIFSLPPMLLVVIGLASIFYGREAIQGEVFEFFSSYIGPRPALEIQNVLQEITLRGDSTWATVIGGSTLLLGATGIFGEIQDSINLIWGLKAKPKKGFIRMVINRLLSFSMILILAFVLLVSLLMSAILAMFLSRLKMYFSDDVVEVLSYIDNVVVFLTISTLFACIFRVLPDAKIKWRQVIIGAFITSLLFMVGEYLIGYYLEGNRTISAYGGAGSVILLLAWVYYSSLILYFGAEFTQVYGRHKGYTIEPNKYAVRVETEVIEKKGAGNRKMANS